MKIAPNKNSMHIAEENNLKVEIGDYRFQSCVELTLSTKPP